MFKDIEQHQAEIERKIIEEDLKPAEQCSEDEFDERNLDLTVGMLLDFIEKHNIPRDSKVLTQRIHDHYFKYNNWKTVQKDCGEDEGLSEYIFAWSPVKYNDDNLYIDAHY